MTYVVDEKCIKCKHMDCVEVCPVDCLWGRKHVSYTSRWMYRLWSLWTRMSCWGYFIGTQDGIEKWAEINRKFSEIWPNISEKKDPPNDAEEWNNVPDKFEKYFSDKPGK